MIHDRRRRGFTLLELGIVIGVSAILAAAIVPDLIESMRNRMAEKSAADVAVIHDAARLFYNQNTQRGGPGLWPGENAPGYCANAYSQDKALLLDLLPGGYLASGGGPTNPTAYDPAKFMRNPWGQPYEMSLYAPSTIATPACMFGVATNIPQVVADAFVSFLPQAYWNLAGAGGPCPLAVNGGAIPAGFVRACSYVPKPGATVNGPCNPGSTVIRDANGFLKCSP